MAEKKRRGPAVRAIAVMSTFLMSGLAHVAVMVLCTGHQPWIWMLFFGAHGTGVVLEAFAFGEPKGHSHSLAHACMVPC